MNKKLLLLGVVICTVAIPAIAAIVQSGWTSTADPATARTALGVFSKGETTNVIQALVTTDGVALTNGDTRQVRFHGGLQTLRANAGGAQLVFERANHGTNSINSSENIEFDLGADLGPIEMQLDSEAGLIVLTNITSYFGDITAETGRFVGNGSGLTDIPASALSSLGGDPGEDKLVFWDDIEGALKYATIGSGLSMVGNELTSTGGGTGSPGGSSGQVQYNNSGAFAGSSLFTFSPLNGGQLTVANLVTSSTNNVTGAVNAFSLNVTRQSAFVNNGVASIIDSNRITTTNLNVYGTLNARLVPEQLQPGTADIDITGIAAYADEAGHAASADSTTRTTYSEVQGWRSTNGVFISEYRIAERCPLPPRIWGSWNDYTVYPFATNITETNILLQAMWMKTNGMWDAGWRWIVIEEGWNCGLDSNGNFLITNRFPNGMKYMADTLREMGFKPGIYTGIGANGPALTCMGFAGTCYTNLDRHMQFFADCGFEFLFLDSCDGYFPWTQGPAGAPVARYGDERALFVERGRLINEAIERAKFKYPPTLLLSAPHALSTNALGTLYPDQQGTHQANIFVISPTNTWDFIASNEFGDIARHYLTNQSLAARLTGKGHYPYGLILPAALAHREMRLAVGWNIMLCAMMNFESGGARRAFPGDPVTYPPSTWNMFGVDDARTNLLAAALHQDPAVIPGYVVYSNASAYMVVKPFGGYNSGTNTVMLVNYGGTSATFQMQHKFVRMPDSVPLTYTDVYFGTNVASLVTSNAAISVPSSNLFLLLSYPSTANPSRELVINGSFRSGPLTGTGASEITATSYAPSDRWFARGGIVQSAANNSFNYYIGIPKWASSVQFSCKVTCEANGTVAWTNTPGYEYYSASAASRVSFDSTSDANVTNTHINTTRTTLTTYTTGFPVPITNAPRFFVFSMGASSNSSARYVLGDYQMKFIGTETGIFP